MSEIKFRKAPRWSRSCFVPICKNNTTNAPNKLFIAVPLVNELKDKWYKAVGNPPLVIRPVCCEDHFDLEADSDNYLAFSYQNCQLKIKKDVVPHKFLNRANPNRNASQVSDKVKSRQSMFKRKLQEAKQSEDTKPSDLSIMRLNKKLQSIKKEISFEPEDVPNHSDTCYKAEVVYEVMKPVIYPNTKTINLEPRKVFHFKKEKFKSLTAEIHNHQNIPESSFTVNSVADKVAAFKEEKLLWQQKHNAKRKNQLKLSVARSLAAFNKFSREMRDKVENCDMSEVEIQAKLRSEWRKLDKKTVLKHKVAIGDDLMKVNLEQLELDLKREAAASQIDIKTLCHCTSDNMSGYCSKCNTKNWQSTEINCDTQPITSLDLPITLEQEEIHIKEEIFDEDSDNDESYDSR